MILSGVVPPICSPLEAEGKIDGVSLRRLVRHLLRAGVDGIFALGSSGECYGLTDRMRHEVAEITLDEVGGSRPVYLGAIDMTTARVSHQINGLLRLSPEGFVVTVPYYARVNQAEIVTHFRRLKDLHSDIDLVAYNIPGATGGVGMDVETVIMLAEEGVIAGLKDSGGNDGWLNSILLARRDRGLTGFRVMTGSELTVDSAILHGADGVVPGLGNVDPQGYVRLVAACVVGDWLRAATEQARLINLFRITQVSLSRTGAASAGHGGFKAALEVLGIIDRRFVVKPLQELTEQEVEEVRTILGEAELLPSVS